MFFAQRLQPGPARPGLTGELHDLTGSRPELTGVTSELIGVASELTGVASEPVSYTHLRAHETEADL
eukprot:2373962-Amphidinium_carterae.1